MNESSNPPTAYSTSAPQHHWHARAAIVNAAASMMHHRGVAARRYDGVGLHLVVVLPVDPLLAGDVRGRQKTQQQLSGSLFRHGQAVQVVALEGIQPPGLDPL